MKKSIRAALAVALLVAPLVGCAPGEVIIGDPNPDTSLNYQDGTRLSPQIGPAAVPYVDTTLRLVNGTGGGG